MAAGYKFKIISTRHTQPDLEGFSSFFARKKGKAPKKYVNDKIELEETTTKKDENIGKVKLSWSRSLFPLRLFIVSVFFLQEK